MNKEKIPYLIENKERDTFTFYVKGTKPYLDLEKEKDQLTNNWNELEEWLESNWKETQDIWYVKIINKMKEIKEK